MPGRVKRSLSDIQKLRAAQFENELVERILGRLEEVRHRKLALKRQSRTHGDGLGMKLADLHALIQGFPVLLEFREFDNVRRACPFGKLLCNLPSLPPAAELGRIRTNYRGRRAVADVGVIFKWPYLGEAVILHTMQPDQEVEGTQLVCRLPDDKWLILEPFSKFLDWLSDVQEKWDLELKTTRKHQQEGNGSE